MTDAGRPLAAAAEGPPPPPPPEKPQKAPHPDRAQVLAKPRATYEAQVTHKRTYGNKLVFLDVRKDPQAEEGGSGGGTPEAPAAQAAPPAQAAPEAPGSEAPSSGARGAGGADSAEAGPEEVVFSFDVYGAEVRRIRKSICVGDVVRFEGAFRDSGARILDAIAYEVVERWSEVAEGKPFDAHRSKPDGDGAGGERPLHHSRVKPIAEPQVLMRDGKLLCKFWLSNGLCRRADCHCEHPEGEELREAKGEYWAAQKKRKAETANPDDPHRLEDKRSHAQRAAVFAEWLCGVYGLEELRSGGVLDVAGGRGELAFELSVKRGIPCTVVDPRCPGPGQGAEPATGSADGAGSAAGAEEVSHPWTSWRLSRPQRQWLEANIESLHGFASCQAHVEASPLRQCQAWVPMAPQEEDLRRWSALAAGCRLVVGLHPDQATGPAVTLARAFGRPFAVVPCCTFADDFPERQLADGRPVRTYEELIGWLGEQNEGSEVVYLPFHGKNAAVYLPPAAVKPACAPAQAHAPSTASAAEVPVK